MGIKRWIILSVVFIFLSMNFDLIKVQAQAEKKSIFYVHNEQELVDAIKIAPENSIVSIQGNLKISKPIQVNKYITIEGNGNKIQAESIFVFEIRDLNGIGNNKVTIQNIILEGSLNTQNPKIDPNEGGIYVKNASNVDLKSVSMIKFSKYGVYADHAKNINLLKCNVENFGYAGFMGFSVENVNITGGKFQGAYGGIGSTNSDKKIAYNIAFTRASEKDEKEFPRSKNCTVRDVLIADNSIWEGLDTHGGENISFIDNTVTNVKYPISAVPSEVKGVDTYAPKNVVIQGNTITNTEGYSKRNIGKAITLSGAKKEEIGSNKQKKVIPVEYATGKIENNIIIGYGEPTAFGDKGLVPTGAIYFQVTEGVFIARNTLQRCYMHGITAYILNKDFMIQNNFIDAFLTNNISDTLGTIQLYKFPSCIAIRDKSNQGQVNENELYTVASPEYTKVQREELNELNLNPDITKRGIYVATKEDVYVTATLNKFGKGINDKYIHMYPIHGTGETAVYEVR